MAAHSPGEPQPLAEWATQDSETIRLMVIDPGEGLGAVVHQWLTRMVGEPFEILTSDHAAAMEQLTAQVRPVLVLVDSALDLRFCQRLADPAEFPEHGVVMLFDRHDARAQADARAAGVLECLVLTDDPGPQLAISIRRTAHLRDAVCLRRSLQKHLHVLTRKLHGIVEAIPEQAVELSRTGQIVDANSAARLANGESAQFSSGKSIADLFDEPSTEPGLRMISEVLETGRAASRVFEVSLGGGMRHLDVRMSPFSPATVIAIVRDVTEKKLAESRLSTLSDRERQLLRLVVRGASNKQAALSLDLSIKTIEAHRSSMMKKLGVRTVAGLVELALAVRDELS